MLGSGRLVIDEGISRRLMAYALLNRYWGLDLKVPRRRGRVRVPPASRSYVLDRQYRAWIAARYADADAAISRATGSSSSRLPGARWSNGNALDRRGGAEALMAVRTVHLRLGRGRPEMSVNAWPGRIRQRVFQGDFTQYHVDWDGRQLIVRSAAG
jgi:TOBE domain